MKMVLTACLLFLLCGGCGSSDEGSDSTKGGGEDNGASGVSVTLSPTDGATDQAVDVIISATFSGAITMPSDWASHLTLRKQGTDANLCTSYSSGNTILVETCAHDNLENGKTYTIIMTGITDSNGKTIEEETSTFTVVSSGGGSGNNSQSDTTPPTFSGARSITANSTSSLTLSWNPATDNQTSASSIVYDIYQAVDDIEGENFATPTHTTTAGATSYTVIGLNSSTTYFYVVRARDATGNRDSNSTEILATTKSADTDAGLPEASTSPSLVSYPSQEGATVYSLLYRPSGATSSNPYPVILYTYGGGGSQNLCGHWHDACDISTGTSNGCGAGGGNYVVLVAGNRGDHYTPSGDCTGTTVTAGGSESRWRGDVNDFLAAIEWLKTKNFINPNRIGVFGESVGGNNALLLAERSPDIKAAVAWFSHVDLAHIYNLWLTDNTINIGWRSAALGGCAPTDSDACAKEYRVRSPINYASKLTMPIQHSHCTADTTVTYQASQVLYDYMNTVGRLNTTYTFFSYDGGTDETDTGNGCRNYPHGPFNQNPWKGLAATRRTSFFDSNL